MVEQTQNDNKDIKSILRMYEDEKFVINTRNYGTLNPNCPKIRKYAQLKSNILTILDFLIENGSITGYLLRENIL